MIMPPCLYMHLAIHRANQRNMYGYTKRVMMYGHTSHGLKMFTTSTFVVRHYVWSPT